METIDIQKIRQLLKEIINPNHSCHDCGRFFSAKELAKEALALLPCRRCGGTKQIRKTLGQINGMPLKDYIGSKIPCPDCQSKIWKHCEKHGYFWSADIPCPKCLLEAKGERK